MRIAELVQIGISELTGAGIANCTSDVYLLLGSCLHMSRTQLLAASHDEVAIAIQNDYISLVNRRKKREPVAYILGEQEFWSRSFYVNPDVLIPRPETEFLVETVLQQLKAEPIASGEIVDLCCGSGVIAITLALELQRNVTAIDVSQKALAVTHHNCLLHGVENDVQLIEGDLLEPISSDRKVSLVVSNPPYVTSSAVRSELEPEVAHYEPTLALDGGELGLDLIVRIREDLPRILAPGGRICMEIGYDQGPAVAELFNQAPDGDRKFTQVEILQDFAGRDRVLYARIT